jgi:hypothetical protein
MTAAMANWRKSTASKESNCAEVGQDGAVVGVRDSQLAESPVLTFNTDAWMMFIGKLKAA